ncbi:ubiquitin carboxyl-terminal hydrolase 16 isoform X2 [Sphaerodactylus townsendi]|uniref:ubiquitin carboxyl-terminal hydrolase 16 isoform X2 n=1 Tax=Sphaerodactylus townsendi TaxID=933632 RepID=UPI002025C0C8|nr:ubiquitin carboxyl-terminal hydrolase 16 isoform X2 [Sphaerodactylus townsendi]
MGKKRIKGRQVQPDESPEVLNPVCKHLRKGLEQGHLKKVLQNVDWNACQDCRSLDSDTHEKCEEEEEDRPSLWLCLKCGHRGCGRDSKEQHALKHYETPRSESHCLALSLDNWSVWCYLCDNDVLYNSSTQLGQLVDYVRKQARVNIKTSASTDEENKQLENKKIKDHRNEEEREKKEILVKDDNLHLNGYAEVTVKGLSNLGNTCFFNAVLQNLSQTPILRELLKEFKMADLTLTIEPPEFSVMEPLVVKLDQARPVTLAMCQFLTEMQETKKGIVSPHELFSQVCKKAIRFKGYQQQDSQELLHYLLDGMRTEEAQRICAGIFKALNNSGDKDNEELKKKIKEYYKGKAPHSFVDRIFGGELTSTIMCEECRTVSLVHESFLDLSLPVLNDHSDKKRTNDKNIKKVQAKELEDEDNNTETNSYLKETDEAPGPSKHLQKKAKKMAKKQAKNQRRQQKLQEKVIHLTDPCVTEEIEVGQNCRKEAERSSEVTDLKQEEESLNQCDKHYADEKENNGEHEITKEVQKLEEESLNQCEEHCVDEKENNGRHEITKEVQKQEEESLNQCEEQYADEKENNGRHEITKEVQNTEKCSENTECCDKEANGEAATDFPVGDVVSAVECVNKFDHLTLREDEMSKEEKELSKKDKIAEEDEDISHIFNELSLDVESDNMDIAYELDSDSKIYEVVNVDSETAFCTLANREMISLEEGSVLHCLYQFTRNEKLCENNKLLCDVCTRRQLSGPKNAATNTKKHIYTNAKKQMLISLAPPILILHLKRFQQARYNLQKVNKHIKFPEIMDLAPFCSVKCKNVVEGSQRVLYSLYGVVEHSGTMRSGHYTAYVKTRTANNQLSDLVLHGKIEQISEKEASKGQWFHISDTHVQVVSVSKVLSAQAYLLFYEQLL